MEKIKKLKTLFNFFDIDGYIVPKNDEFFNEYIPCNKDNLKFISDFSGSFGFALIIKNKNYLFVDGRYTLQAEQQSGKNFEIINLAKKLPFNVLKNKKLKIGFNSKLFTQKTLSILFKNFNRLKPIDEDLIEKIQVRKIKESRKKFYALPKKAFDQSHKIKIRILIKWLIKRKIDIHFISSSENISWLLNIRGQDLKYTPSNNSYLIIDTNYKINLFCDLKKLNRSFILKFKKIKFIDIKFLSLFLSKIKNKNILIDSTSCSFYYENLLNGRNFINKTNDPIYNFKSRKTKNEMSNIIKSHLYDGVALTKFLFWIKKNYLKANINEIIAQDKLYKFRKKNKKFKFSSFPTISGSGPNGAIIHYRATNKSNRKLKKGDIYLVDSGGQYNFGTTDVTRTISLGNNNQRIKEIFTRVLKGHIAVASFKLSKKTTGSQIDSAARKPLKKIKLDYPHGTGHGVGYFLNVHEGPQAISKKNNICFQDGMIISNEPGYYEKGKFGIRIENLLRVKKNGKKIVFDNLTLAPIDKSLIDKKNLNFDEINWLNKYHNRVFTSLKKFMNKSEIEDLKLACSRI